MEKTKKTAIGYIRVSTKEQATEKHISLEVQEKRIKQYCSMREMKLLAIIKDPGVSTDIPLLKREGGKDIGKLIADGNSELGIEPESVDAIVALHLDRLFRDVVDCLTTVEKWKKSGVEMHLVDLGGQSINTSTAIGKQILTILASVCEMQKNLIKEKTKAALDRKKEKGEAISRHPPIGYRREGDKLVEDIEEQNAIINAKELRADGWTVPAIVNFLNEKCPRGKGLRWKKDIIYREVKDVTGPKVQTKKRGNERKRNPQSSTLSFSNNTVFMPV